MSEFKFACPVCGQHITADSSASGSQLDCPTCFRKIVIPQAPASRESKFVLAASEASRPRSVQSAPTPAGPAQTTKPAFGLVYVIAAGAMLIATIAIGSFIWLRSHRTERADSNKPASPSIPPRVMPAGTVPWSLELASASFPAETAFGRIRGSDFVCDRAVLQGNQLNLRMGREWPPQLGLSIHLYARSPEDLSGRSALVTSNNIRSPRVVLRWREGQTNRVETFTNGYALKLEFGALKGNRLPGKIYLCVPDQNQSCVAGVFNAEIRRPSPPRPDTN
jgi:hypothetical protein